MKHCFATLIVFASLCIFFTACEKDPNAPDSKSGKSDGKIKGHEYVDLGLPSGLKWATCNVGASSPEEYGDYFAWGEVKPKNNYTESTYEWYDELTHRYTKYSFGPAVEVELDMVDDAARINWGGNWRIPTILEWSELMRECTCTWTTQNGVGGRVCFGPNGNSIFLPAAGYRGSDDLYNQGSCGYYWSSSLYTDSPNRAWDMRVDSNNFSRYGGDGRFNGFSIRPVIE